MDASSTNQPPYPPGEAARLDALRRLNILDTQREPHLDRIVALVASLLDAPIGVLSLVDADREWFKACTGTDQIEGPRAVAFCSHAIMSDEPLVVPDATLDPRFRDNPKVVHGGIRAYAGHPIRLTTGERLGSLCVKDTRPRAFTAEHLSTLAAFAAVVASDFEARRVALECAAVLTGPRLAEQTLDGLADVIFWVDDHGRVVDARGALTHLLGYTREAVLGRPISDFDENLVPELWRHHRGAVRASDRPLVVRSALKPREGPAVPVELSMHSIEFERTRFDVIHARDITERSRSAARVQRTMAELEAARAELEHRSYELAAANARTQDALSVKSRFLATMSHEIRTPLNGVLGMIELLSATALDEKQAKYAATARNSADALRALVDDILDFSKLEAGRVTLESVPCRPADLVEDVAASFRAAAEQKGIALRASVDTGIPSGLLGDPHRLRQVLVNLIGNAVKFTATGAVVARGVLESAGPGRVVVRFTVTDSGIGIARDRVETLFQPFIQADSTTTRRYGGTGLGLAICKQIVELMQGRIGVESEPGKGSTFWFEVPFAVSEAPGSCEPQAGDHAGLFARPIIFFGGVRAASLAQKLAGVGARVQASAWPADLVASMAAAPAEAVVVLDPPTGGDPGFASILRGHVRAALVLAFDADGSGEQLPGFIDCPLEPTDDPAAFLAQLAEAMVLASRAPEAPAPSEGRVNHAERWPGLRGLRVLLAEDNDINIEVATGLLAGVGIAPEVVGHGMDAVQRMREQRFDIVLMDCRMPVMDGFTATQMIRSAEAEAGGAVRTPIIALTADAMSDDRARCVAVGMDAHVAKPINPETLFATISSLVGTGHAGEARREHHEESQLPQATPAIDLNDLLQRCMGKPALAARLLAKFEPSIGERCGALRAGLDAGDADRVAAAAHAIKGSAANLGATALARHAAEAEHAAKAGDLAAARSAVDAVISAFDAAAREVPGLLAGPLAPREAA